jgi:endonuclease YncB( thermonuclease family)
MTRLLIAVLFSVVSTFAQAQTCVVTSVHDGDSLRVRCPGHQKTIPVRLDQVDAPEIKQAHGIKSRDYLRSVCVVGKPIVIETHGLDQYKRTLGTVSCGGVNANAAMVGAGHAWVYDGYAKDRTLYTLQDKAKAGRIGLWQRSNAIAPWEFRKSTR